MEDKRRDWRNSVSSRSNSQLGPLLAILGTGGENRQKGGRRRKGKEGIEKKNRRNLEGRKNLPEKSSRNLEGRKKKTLGRMHVTLMLDSKLSLISFRNVLTPSVCQALCRQLGMQRRRPGHHF